MEETTGDDEDQKVISTAADLSNDTSIALKPKGEWTTVIEDPQHADDEDSADGASTKAVAPERPDGEPFEQTGGCDGVNNEHEKRHDSFAETGNIAIDEDADGEPLDEDADGEQLNEDADGEPLDVNDGFELQNDDADGEPLDYEDEDADGEPLDEDAGGEPLNGDPDGELLDDKAL